MGCSRGSDACSSTAERCQGTERYLRTETLLAVSQTTTIKPITSPCVLIIQTWGGELVDLFVGDGHHGVVELLHELGDGLVGQEDGHGRQHQVDEDEDDGEDVLQAGFVESHRWTAFSDVVLCGERRGGRNYINNID